MPTTSPSWTGRPSRSSQEYKPLLFGVTVWLLHVSSGVLWRMRYSEGLLGLILQTMRLGFEAMLLTDSRPATVQLVKVPLQDMLRLVKKYTYPLLLFSSQDSFVQFIARVSKSSFGRSPL